MDVRDEQVGELVPALLIDEAEVPGLGDADGLDDLEPVHGVHSHRAPLARLPERERRVRIASDGSHFHFREESCHDRPKQRTARLRRADVPRAGRLRDRAAGPRRLQREVRHELVPRRRGRRGQVVVRGRRNADREGRRRDRRLSADRWAPDAGRSVRAGEDRCARRHGSRPVARGLDRPDDPRARGRAQRRRVGSFTRRDRHLRRARTAARELPQAHRRLQVARRAGVRRHPRSDDLRQLPHLAAHRRRDRRSRDRMDGRTQVRERLLLHGGQRRHPDRGRDVRELAVPAGPEEGRPVLGGRLVGPRLRRLLPRRSDPSRVSRSRAR